jgi:hypothetical protein
MFLRQVSSAIRRNIVKYSTEAVQENANPPVKKETLIQQWSNHFHTPKLFCHNFTVFFSYLQKGFGNFYMLIIKM